MEKLAYRNFRQGDVVAVAGEKFELPDELEQRFRDLGVIDRDEKADADQQAASELQTLQEKARAAEAKAKEADVQAIAANQELLEAEAEIKAKALAANKAKKSPANKAG